MNQYFVTKTCRLLHVVCRSLSGFEYLHNHQTFLKAPSYDSNRFFSGNQKTFCKQTTARYFVLSRRAWGISPQTATPLLLVESAQVRIFERKLKASLELSGFRYQTLTSRKCRTVLCLGYNWVECLSAFNGQVPEERLGFWFDPKLVSFDLGKLTVANNRTFGS